jgi:hypothetical protein
MKLTVTQLVNKLPAFYGTQRFITVFTKARADHSPPSSVEVKNAWSYTSTPQYAFMAWCSVKHRDNFTFTWNVQVMKLLIMQSSPVSRHLLPLYRIINIRFKSNYATHIVTCCYTGAEYNNHHLNFVRTITSRSRGSSETHSITTWTQRTEADDTASQLITALNHTARRPAKHWCHWLVQGPPNNTTFQPYGKQKTAPSFKTYLNEHWAHIHTR